MQTFTWGPPGTVRLVTRLDQSRRQGMTTDQRPVTLVPFVDSLPTPPRRIEQLEDRLWRLRLDYPKGFCTLDEYVRPGAGAHLQILDAILEVLMPVIETSRGKPRWYWPAAGEKYRTFDSWGALLADGGTWTA